MSLSESPSSSKSEKPFDIVLYGATGFVGKLASHYLASRSAEEGIRFAIAGRDARKLDVLRAELESSANTKVPVLLANSNDNESIAKMVSQTRVVLSTAGPFQLYSEPVVCECVKQGVDYTDITGETTWVKTVVDRFHDEAVSKGVHIVPQCGFDSAPSDLGTLFAVLKSKSMFGAPVEWVANVVDFRGKFSGGTAHTLLLNLGKTSSMDDPFLLVPRSLRKRESLSVDHDPLLGSWSPSHQTHVWSGFLSPGNSRIVRRSAALYQQLSEENVGFSDVFVYKEGEKMSGRIKAFMASASMLLFTSLCTLSPFRYIVSKIGQFLVPKPGDGPSKEERDKSSFVETFVARPAGKAANLVTTVRGGDPGYSETAKMVSEMALFLATQKKKSPFKGGVLTPATSGGPLLIDRFQKSGIKFDVQTTVNTDSASCSLSCPF